MRLLVVLMMAVASAGCILGTPAATFPIQSDCPYPFDFASRSWNESTSLEPHESEVRLSLKRTSPFAQSGDISSVVEIENRDVDEVRMKLIVDAGGSHSLEFGVILPVKKVGDYEYEFPEGPIVISGDQCPPAP